MILKPPPEPAEIAPHFERLRVVEDPEPRSGPVHMALDETLLHACADGPPLLRFYRWAAPAVSFGYFEPAEDARRLARGRQIVRRMTGGGLVEHGDDVTYALVVPRSEPFVNLCSTETYRLIHAALASALARTGVAVHSHQESWEPVLSSDGNACFQRPVPHDLVTDGGKIAGGAQRRTRAGLLHQGSVRLVRGAYSGWNEALRDALPMALACGYDQRLVTSAELAHANTLAAAKYATAAWTDRR